MKISNEKALNNVAQMKLFLSRNHLSKMCAFMTKKYADIMEMLDNRTGVPNTVTWKDAVNNIKNNPNIVRVVLQNL